MGRIRDRIELVIWDWDGTLMDSIAGIEECFARTATDLGVEPPRGGAARGGVGLSLSDSFARLYPDLDAHGIERLVDRYRANWIAGEFHSAPLYPGVREGLGELVEAGYLLAVATGKSARGLRKALEITDLGECFVYPRCADQSRSKPHPQMVLDIIDYTGVEPDACLVVGDTTFDMEMARGANVASWGVGYGSHSAEKMSSLSDFQVATSFKQVACGLLDHEQLRSALPD